MTSPAIGSELDAEIVRAVAQLKCGAYDANELATKIREAVDEQLDHMLGPTLVRDDMPRNDRQAFAALAPLEGEPGEPFWVTGAAVAAESDVRPISIGISMYRLERD